MNKTILIVIVTFLNISLADAQIFINEDFTIKHTNNTLFGWAGTNGKIEQDSVTKSSGRYSCRFTNEGEKGIISLFLKDYEARNLHKKTLVLKADVKCEFKDPTNTASLYIEVYIDGAMISKTIAIGEKLSENENWQNSSVTLHVEDSFDKSAIAIGVLIGKGVGTVWLDNVKLYADGKLINTPIRATPLNNNEVKWLIDNSYNINNTSLDKFIDNVRIIGIGEETHNSKSVKTTRMDLVDNLVNNNNFTIITEELLPFKFSDVNNLYTYDKAEDYKWSLADPLDKSKIKLKRIGAKISPSVLIDELSIMSGDKLTSETNLLRHLISPFTDKFTNISNGYNISIVFKPKDEKKILNALNRCNSWARKNIDDPFQLMGFEFTTQLLTESLSMSTNKRDELIANIIEFISKLHPNDKLIFLAHNMRVKRQASYLETTGHHLSLKFGNQYYAIATTFNDGRYRSINIDRLRTVTAQTAFLGTYEYMFNSISKSCFLLPLRGVPMIVGQNDWLFSKMLFRQIETMRIDEEFEYSTDIKNEFDAILFLKTSTIH